MGASQGAPPNEAGAASAGGGGSIAGKVATYYRGISGKSAIFGAEAANHKERRVLIATDMSTECDDECALLWILSALNKRNFPTTIELLMSDSQVRYQWMAYLFHEKMCNGGEWEVEEEGSRVRVGCVCINFYLAHDADRENGVIDSIQSKAPQANLDVEEFVGPGGKPKKRALRRSGSIGGLPSASVPAGPLECIIIAGPIPSLAPEFFDRFTDVRCSYVVGTPGGINCPMPSWANLLASLKALAPVLYLTPQFTRGVRFPRTYVLKNDKWNAYLKRTIFDSTLMCMAKRPEIPAKFGNWGLVLRLNVANSTFCKDWYRDVMGKDVTKTRRPQELVDVVQAYVDRNSGDDRQPGAIVNELQLVGIEAEPLDSSPEARERVREHYRRELFEHTYVCVATTASLIWQNRANWTPRTGPHGFKTSSPRCGYVAPHRSLAETWGDEAALDIVKTLPLQKLTPAYDVVAMICAVSAMEIGNLSDLGLDIQVADDSMGRQFLSEEQWHMSDHPVQMMAQQTDAAIACQVHQLMS